jgi:DNA-binding NarL/FixJ family response regulator
MRVLIVDPHPVTRDGLRAALGTAADVEIVGEAASGEEAVEMVEASKPDVAFMDVRMPGMNGIEATKQIKEKYPDTKIILFTVDESRASISEAIQAGVSGYLLKDVGADELVNAARLALEGKAVIHPTLTQAFIEEVRLSDWRPEAPLSRREIEILQKLAHGSSQELADFLGVPLATVKRLLMPIFEKLALHDRDPPEPA